MLTKLSFVAAFGFIATVAGSTRKRPRDESSLARKSKRHFVRLKEPHGSYYGEIKARGEYQIPHGRGEMSFNVRKYHHVVGGARFYDGQWVEGQMRGRGKMKYARGSRNRFYDGQWVEGLRHGHGELIFQNGCNG